MKTYVLIEFEIFLILESEDKDYKHHKVFYGHGRIELKIIFNRKNLKEVKNEVTLYVKRSNNEVWFIVSLYVNDLLIIRNESNCLKQFKQDMENEFEITHLDEMKYFLEMDIFLIK
ncbi:hypothetical protein CR513_58708, partial [Mucuna pruriens]